jgi:vacuolar protein sorting-associated protein 35
VFSDDFHLQTLQLLLKTCPKLEDGVDVKSIIGSLIDRISDFLLANPEIKPSQNVFTLFSKYINKVLEEREDMPLDNVLALQVSLLNLALRCYNDKKEYIDQVLVYSAKRLSEARAANPAGTLPRAVMDQAMKLLNTPLDSFKNILRVLQLESYPTVIEALDFDNRRRIAIAIIRSCLDNGTTVHIPEAESAEKLFNLLKPLLQDVADKKDLDDEDFADEQNLVASLLHLLRSPNAEDLFGMLIAARKTFEAGGLRRRKYTYPSLFFVSMRLVQQLLLAKETDADWEKKARKVVQFALALVSGLQETDAHHVALNCALQCAQIASVCKFDNVAYNAFDKAFREIYEEKIVKSKEQYDSIRLIVATLRTLHCFDEDTYDKFVAQTAKAANNLMNRADQCRAIAMCSHLLWVPDAEKPIKDPQRVFECLLKASKIADSIGDETNASLFVEILNEYLFFFQENNEAVRLPQFDTSKIRIALNLSSLFFFFLSIADHNQAYCSVDTTRKDKFPRDTRAAISQRRSHQLFPQHPAPRRPSQGGQRPSLRVPRCCNCIMYFCV